MSNKTTRSYLKVVLPLIFSILAFPMLWNCGLIGDDKPDYWPTDSWQTATPESQGMDSSLLLNMLDVIWQRDIDIDSVLIVRNGYIVLDAYSFPFAAKYTHRDAVFEYPSRDKV